MRRKQDERQEYWREQVTRGNRHAAGIASYCRIHSIRPAAFYYWKKRFGDLSPAKRVTAESFLPVKILRSEAAPSLPDAKWLAELIGNLMRDSR